MKKNPEFSNFSKAMDIILRADPGSVKAAMDAEKREPRNVLPATGRASNDAIRPPMQPHEFQAVIFIANHVDLSTI